MTNTKIITTIGPASEERKVLANLIEAGANVFRFNMKHGEIGWHSKVMERAQSVANEKHFPLGLMIDLQGPEIRINTKKEVLEVDEGEEVYFGSNFLSKEESIKISNNNIINCLEKGDRLLVDDGFYEFVVTEEKREGVMARAERDSKIGNKKGLNIPTKKLDLPSLIEEDLEKLDLAVKKEIDYISLSFTRTKKDVKVLREAMKKKGVDSQIIAKIENKTALQNLEEIIDEADGIMVARGDLGIETPLEGIAYWQKKIIQKCRRRNTPVIVATQMLQSMTRNPIPTRAEVTDVANAVFNGTDAVMLSGETAMGNYPVEAVETMTEIVDYNETEGQFPIPEEKPDERTGMLMRAAIDLIKSPESSPIKAVLVFTKDGDTVRKMASYRPGVPIIAVSDRKEIIEELSICYGVKEYYSVFKKDTLEMPSKIVAEIKENSFLQEGDKILLIQAQKWELPELSDSITILEV